ncbi:nuclear transport factor 2 family protein [Stenotrophomonas sp.]|uniref:nuclear transport factor 2 family protein n=1 Tax=Stenotrophomonas sp. TaxID=69392 RepID=UPI002D2416AD|nr:nuclear transport factor 2 family protein [Stenotrophomonas sp.]HYQ23055.1 nuclear transport factor 2 family protein [Stenotrophomonas sp.]
MSVPSTTEHLASDKQSVLEALYRFAAGIDLRDRTLLASAFAENAISDFRPAAAKAGFEYPVLQGRDIIVEALASSLSQVDTTHSISNPRVRIDGDSASVDLLVEAQHASRDDPGSHYLMKNRYDVALSRKGDVWVIEQVTVDNVWRTGNPRVLGLV